MSPVNRVCKTEVSANSLIPDLTLFFASREAGKAETAAPTVQIPITTGFFKMWKSSRPTPPAVLCLKRTMARVGL
jgi:hypothetical protein